MLLDISQDRFCSPKYGYFSEDEIFWNFLADIYYIEGLNMSKVYMKLQVSFQKMVHIYKIYLHNYILGLLSRLLGWCQCLETVLMLYNLKVNFFEAGGKMSVRNVDTYLLIPESSNFILLTMRT